MKKPSLPLLNFKTGHFALRREENIVEFLEGRFHNQQLSLVDKKKSEHSNELSLSIYVFQRKSFKMWNFGLENHRMMWFTDCSILSKCFCLFSIRKKLKNAQPKKLQGNDERVIQTLNSAIKFNCKLRALQTCRLEGSKNQEALSRNFSLRTFTSLHTTYE